MASPPQSARNNWLDKFGNPLTLILYQARAYLMNCETQFVLCKSFLFSFSTINHRLIFLICIRGSDADEMYLTYFYPPPKRIATGSRLDGSVIIILHGFLISSHLPNEGFDDRP